MNINILMISLGIVALSSCSTAYKTGQTPDDVYYSAPKEVLAAGGDEEYLAVNNRKDRYSGERRQSDVNYDDYETYRNDRWLRMSIGSPYRLSTFNNYYWNDWGYSGLGYGNYGYNGFGFNASFGNYYDPFYSPYGSSMYWNSFYNPYAFNYNPLGYGYGYGGGHIGVNPNVKPPIYRTNTARTTTFNPRAYGNSANRSSNVNASRTYYNPRTGSYRNYNNTNGNRVSTGSTPNGRRATSDGGTYYNNNNSRSSNTNTYTPSSNNTSSGSPARSYTPSSSGSSSGGSGSSGGGGGMSRPSRN